jgi:hypothetical protein
VDDYPVVKITRKTGPDGIILIDLIKYKRSNNHKAALMSKWRNNPPIFGGRVDIPRKMPDPETGNHDWWNYGWG